MNSVQIEIPDSMRQDLADLGYTSPDEVAHWLMEAASKVIRAEKDFRAFRKRAARGSREEFERVLAQFPNVEPEEYDRLSASPSEDRV